MIPDRGNESYSYDANGNVTQTVDARGASGTFYAGYDGLNRQMWRNTSDTSSGAYVTYSYDSTTGGNDGVGRLTGESFNGGAGGAALGHGQYSYAYDARGQQTSWGVTLGGATSTIGYSYTDSGASNTVTYSDGEVASYSYSGSGALLSLSATPAGGSATTLFGTLLYSTDEGQSGLLRSAQVANGVYTYTPTHDPLLRFNSLTWTLTSSGATIFGASRSFDNVSNVATVTTIFPGGTSNQAFCYDEQNRLNWTAGEGATGPCGVSITTGTLAAAAYGLGAVTYDTLDRMTSSASGTNVYGDSAHLHAQTSNGPVNSASYDAAGDMTCRSTTSSTQCSTSSQTGQLMTYDDEGRMTGWQDAPTNPTNTEQMAYDGEGARVALQVNNGTPTYYVGSLEELTGGSVTKYFTGGSQGSELPLVERVGTGGALAYLAGDLLGSVDATLDGSGNVTSSSSVCPSAISSIAVARRRRTRGSPASAKMRRAGWITQRPLL